MRAHRGATIVVALVVLSLAGTLLFIGASSPYTHANLNAAYDEGYTRTAQIVVGPAQPFMGLSHGAPAAGDAVARGARLFVTEGCVGCHALAGQGGAVAKAIAGADVALIAQRVRQGTPGMPPFAMDGLTDDQLADIATYLRSLPAVK
jgi:mono/diheme cytochrome c family protein